MVSGMMHQPVECDKRVRREIANSNERRRMQSINAGFEQLKVLLPAMSESDKLSKANILKLTAKYINSLLSKINHLENEVASIHNIQCKDPSRNSSSSEQKGLSKKRKVCEKRTSNKKRLEIRDLSPRRQLLKVIHDTPDSSPVTMPHLSPISSAPSFCNDSQNSPEYSESSNAARLEHLVMAIEKIEGDFRYSQSEGSNSDNSNESSDLIRWSFPMPLDSSQANDSTINISNISTKTVLPKTAVITSNSPIYESESNILIPLAKNLSPPVMNYPLVAKMLNRGPIPHKYLHRPQVVVNSSQ